MARKDTAIFDSTAQEQGMTAPVQEPAGTAPARTAEVDASGFYCYIGPNLAGLIQHGTIYRGSRADALAAAAPAIEKQPMVKTLIVSGDELPEARLKVKQPGNALYVNYRKIAGKQ